MSEASLHHRYDITHDGCRYCYRRWGKISDEFCMPIAQVVDSLINRAKFEVCRDSDILMDTLHVRADALGNKWWVPQT